MKFISHDNTVINILETLVYTITIIALIYFHNYLNKYPNSDATSGAASDATTDANVTASTNPFIITHNYRILFTIVSLGCLIIITLLITHKYSIQHIIFITILAVLNIYIWRQSSTLETFMMNLQSLDHTSMDYQSSSEASKSNYQLSDIHEAHPDIDKSQLINGINRPEHYDFAPDDIPADTQFSDNTNTKRTSDETLNALKNLKHKLSRDKNYKYVANIKPWDPQALPSDGKDTGLELSIPHGIEHIFMDQNKPEYKLAKEVLSALAENNTSTSSYYRPIGTWRKGELSPSIKDKTHHQRNNGVGASQYKFIQEPDLALGGGDLTLECNQKNPETNNITSVNTNKIPSVGPVMLNNTIPDDSINKSNKLTSFEAFYTNSTTNSKYNTHEYPVSYPTEYMYEADQINTKMPGSSQKVSQSCTNYPLVNSDSLKKISGNAWLGIP